jgi:hypothetical protein
VQPKIINHQSRVTTEPAGEVTITCYSVGSPLPDMHITDGDGHDVVVNKSTALNETLRVIAVTLSNVRRSERYTCVAKNELGEDTQEVQVQVLGRWVVAVSGATGIYRCRPRRTADGSISYCSREQQFGRVRSTVAISQWRNYGKLGVYRYFAYNSPGELYAKYR